jgi:hypothetical protein
MDWRWSRPSGHLDEEVLADLQRLGWEPLRKATRSQAREGAVE